MNLQLRIACRLTSLITSKFNPKNQSGILYFHRVLEKKDPFYADDPTTKEFDELLSFLKVVFHVVAVEDIVSGNVPTDKPSIALSFDDGYLDNKVLALPILKKYGIKATFFIATEGIKTGILWQDKVIESYRQGDAAGFEKMGFAYQGRKSERVLACMEHLSLLKRLRPHERDAEVDALLDVFSPEIERLMMSENDIIELYENGHTIGAHSVGHEILSGLSDDLAKEEIEKSKLEIETIISSKIQLFCYPNGIPEKDFHKKHQEMVANAGFSAAFSTKDGGVSISTNRFAIPRFLPHRRNSLMRTLSSAKIMGEL